ncbi:MAG: hypothetical protein KY466_09975 [Gemmatimonadetes bacterium]|nr:hypothetical protein [Gemmatimonadota bacterium]
MLVLTAAALAALVAPATAQTSAPAHATLTVVDVMRLSVADAGESVRLDVTANRPWQVVAVLEDESGRTWSAGAVASGGPGRVPVELSYRALAEAAGAPERAALRFTLSAL